MADRNQGRLDGRSRYDRSRYGSAASRDASQKGASGRASRRAARSTGGDQPVRQSYYDSFYDDMRLPEEPASAAPRAHDVSQRDYAAISSKRRRNRTVLIVLGVVAGLVLVGAIAAFAYVNNVSRNLHEGVDQDLRNALVATDMAREPFYLLLLGTDGSAERDSSGDFGGQYRSDSMMLARIDPVGKKVALVSISRDTMVDLGQYGDQKINSAYGFGGPALAVEAVAGLAGVDISHYAQVDFDGFSALVDALGGVEVDVPIDIDDWEAGGSVSAGLQTLNGQQALILCRSRNAYAATAAHPDEMRAANQRLVLAAIAKKLLSSDVATIASSVQVMSQYVTTDLGLNDIIGLAQIMRGLDPETDIYTAMAPTISEYIDYTWCEYIDKKTWSDMMARINAGLPPTEESRIDEVTGTVLATAGGGSSISSGTKYATVTVKNGTERQGLAAKTRTLLMDAGFFNVVIGDIAEGYAYPETLVIYNEAVRAYEADQIVAILGQGETFLNDGSYLLADTDFLVVIGDDWRDAL